VIKKRESAFESLRHLWRDEGYKLFYKGLTARLSYSALHSLIIVFGYETVKNASIKEEYKHLFYEKY
jgi:hypothetical protein